MKLYCKQVPSETMKFYSINDNQNMQIMSFFYMKSIQVNKDRALGSKEQEKDRRREKDLGREGEKHNGERKCHG